MISRKNPRWEKASGTFTLGAGSLDLTVYPHGVDDEEGSVELSIEGEAYERLEKAIVDQEKRRRARDVARIKEAAASPWVG